MITKAHLTLPLPVIGLAGEESGDGAVLFPTYRVRQNVDVFVTAWARCSAAVKFAIVLIGTLSVSWLAAALLRRVPLVARII
jgi:hypothetical protein